MRITSVRSVGSVLSVSSVQSVVSVSSVVCAATSAQLRLKAQALRLLVACDEDEHYVTRTGEESTEGATGCRYHQIRRWFHSAEAASERDCVHADAGAPRSQT